MTEALKGPWLGVNGYPTEEALERIRTAAPEDITDLLQEAWHKGYGSATTNISEAEREVLHPWEDEAEFLRLATGGWSGNEELYAAYKENFIARMLTWRLSAAGGLHILQRYEKREEKTE